MNRRWENDGIFVSMNFRIVRVIQYRAEYDDSSKNTPCLLEDQRTGEIFEPKDTYDCMVGGDFTEMEIIALMASDEPIQL